MKCPNCKETNLSISERQGIEIDFCPECRGIWLDRGELDKIMERSRVEFTPERQEAPRFEQKQDKDKDYKHYKRKKSFIEELFD